MRDRLKCVQCGCDELHACKLAGGMPCSWVLPDLCSNPACLARDSRTPVLPGIVPARFIKTVIIGTSEPAQRRSGGYEWGCQILLFRALRWLKEHPETKPSFTRYRNIVGLFVPGNEPAEAALSFVLDHPALKRIGVTGAMVQFSLMQASVRYRLGDEAYFQAAPPQDIFEFDETQAFPEEQTNALPR